MLAGEPIYTWINEKHFANKENIDINFDVYFGKKMKSSTNTLTHFRLMLYFYTPWKHPKTGRFLMFSGGVEVEHWLKMG